MAIKHNNVIPNVHFRKWWQRYVKTWFNQAARKKARRTTRQQKAAKNFPRPTGGLLRPVVHPPTVRYNFKLREGRGFTLDELKAAGIPAMKARSIGIAVDHRRRNHCEESLNENVARLNEYKSKLAIFPRKSGKKGVKKGDTARPALKDVKQATCKTVLPIKRPALRVKARAITDAEKDPKKGAYKILRKAREVKKNVGRKIRRATQKAKTAKV